MDARTRRAAGLLAVASLIAGCAGAGTPTTAPTSQPTAPPASTPAATPAPTPVPSPAVTFLEDTGLEEQIPPGEYASRVFRPELTLRLGDGWMRRDDIHETKVNLRRMADAAEDVTFIGRVDFLQCGDDAVVASPSTEAVLAGITGADPLAIAEPWDAPVGARTGTVLRLTGGGPIPEDFAQTLDFGCALSTGDAPFPAESGWVLVTRDQSFQYVVVDVDGSPVVIRSRPGDTTRDLDAFFDLTLELIATAQLG